MNPYIQKLNQYLREHPFDPGQRNADGVLNYLVTCYLDDTPVSSDRIKEIQNKMEPYYENVPFETSNRLFALVYDLCSAYEDAAFREGLLVGLHLQKEIDA